MKVVASLILLLVNVRLSRCCYGEGQILFCTNVPSVFLPGFSSLVFAVKDVGEMNSTVLRSDNLSSVTRLRLENAGVTAVAQGAFDSLRKLTNLSLNQNLLTEMNSNWFGRPEILSELILTDNRIEDLSEFVLSGLTGLTSLSLSKNRITAIHPNSFSYQTNLAELDLSENRMTRVSPQVFKSLGSTRIRLDGNPWDCSCGAEEFVDFLKDLQSRSLLDRPVEVTCESPPSLRGRPVWNVSACATTTPPPGPPSVTQTIRPKPTDDIRPPSSVITTPSARPTSVQPKPSDTLTTVPPSTVVATPSSPATPKAETSVRPKPTDAALTLTATPPARPTSETKTSVRPKPSDILPTTTAPSLQTDTSVSTATAHSCLNSFSTTLNSLQLSSFPINFIQSSTNVVRNLKRSIRKTDETYVTSPPSVTEISVHPKPSDLPTYTLPASIGVAETTLRPTSDTNICTLVVVIVLLSLLLLVVCFLAVLHGRKRHNKAVTPGCPKKTGNESEEENASSRSSRARPPGDSGERGNNQWDSEMGWRRSFTEVRAKSANAVLFTSPFRAPVKDQVSFQPEAEARSKDSENGAEGKQKLESETDTDGGFETEKATKNLDKDLHCVSVNTDTVPYLSIGTNQNRPDDLNGQSTDDPGQRLQTSKALGRISTWPPTAVQWQARRQIKENEETEASDVLTVWTPKFPGEANKELNKVEIPFSEDEVQRNQIEDSLKIDRMKVGLSCSPETNEETTPVSEAHSHTDTEQREKLKEEEMIQDAATVTHTISETPHQTPTPAGTSGDKPDPKRAVTSRQKAEGRGTGSKAPSGGASPDDETLLSGNEYAFMDLLHEVVQNNGRWTRERWRQTHANKQRH